VNDAILKELRYILAEIERLKRSRIARPAAAAKA